MRHVHVNPVRRVVPELRRGTVTGTGRTGAVGVRARASASVRQRWAQDLPVLSIENTLCTDP